APVRIHLRLSNLTPDTLPAPSSLSLTAGCLRGRVIDATGVARAFTPVLVYPRSNQLENLDPATPREGTPTLFAGPDGDVCRAAGVYRIAVDVMWRGVPKKGALMIDIGVSGETTVTVTPA